jgi:carboxylesterase
MPQPEYLNPFAYAAGSGPVGVLLVHGFTGSVAETRPMGEYLAKQGLAVRCPLLPGHGTQPQDLTHIRWQAWVDQVELALRDLSGKCGSVFVGGLSLGSLLTLWLGASHSEVAGLIAMAPAIKVQNRLMPLTLVLRHLFEYSPFGPMGDTDLGDPAANERSWCYDQLPLCGAAEVYLLQRRVNSILSRIHQPILIFQGRRDAHLQPRAAQVLYDRVASTDKTLVWLEKSGHNLLIDGERESVWAQSYAWIRSHVT